MAQFLAVANRKGGVGKSTISVMLAHAFAVWGAKRVLLMDLDSQCNASLILQGGEGWLAARKAHKTIADYFLDVFDESAESPREYLVHRVGDIRDLNGKPPALSLLPGSLLLEDAQGELYLKEARQAKDPDLVSSRVRGRLERLLRRFEGTFDIVILDCAPGLSFAALAALKTADLVLVPFRPDYVSQLAVDRVALLIEGKRTGADLAELPLDARRYACLANAMRDTSKERNIYDEIALDHPMLTSRIPMSPAIADAFDFRDSPASIVEKYGDATDSVRGLYEEVASRLTLRMAA
ncbi:MAG: ParA family protein [Hyphomicrobiaceae bacterium]|nr:ParA family protein [Hyphomicrobiaceae bacterium]